MEHIRGDFNTMIVDLAAQIALVCPTSIIATSLSTIKTLIVNHPNTIIDIFVQKVLKYKQKIDEGNDSFFLNNSFTEETEGDSTISSRIFEFKSIWKQLNQSNRETVKQYMKFLCELALAYTNELLKNQ